MNMCKVSIPLFACSTVGALNFSLLNVKTQSFNVVIFSLTLVPPLAQCISAGVMRLLFAFSFGGSVEPKSMVMFGMSNMNIRRVRIKFYGPGLCMHVCRYTRLKRD